MHRLAPRTVLAGAFSLRPLTLDDAAAWLAIVTDARVFGPTSWDVQTVEQLLPALGRHVTSGRRWAIERLADGALVGTCGTSASDQAREVEVAYELAPDVWGLGLATAAVMAFVDEARAGGVERLLAHTWVGNGPSARVLERCGFAREARLDAFRSCRGELRDYFRWSLVLG